MIYRFDDLRIDTDRFELRRGDDIRQVEPLVFDLIRYLAANPNRVVTRDEIIEHVWHGRIVSDATVSGCVKSARRALDDSGEDQRRIRTVRGRGFHLIGEVSADAGADEAPGGVEEPNASVTPVTREARSVSKPDRPAIAVVPFTNQSAEFDKYFADGLSEDIITNLTRFRELRVIARGSTSEFRGQSANLPRLVAELGADFVVEGGVRRAAGRVRVSARLIDAISGVHVWAERYDRDMEDIFAVQDEVTRTIAAALGVKVQDAALRRAMAKNPAELGAYDSVLRARRYTWNLNEAEHAEARDLLENAVAQDPNNGDAHALLANVYLAEHRFDHNPRPDPTQSDAPSPWPERPWNSIRKTLTRDAGWRSCISSSTKTTGSRKKPAGHWTSTRTTRRSSRISAISAPSWDNSSAAWSSRCGLASSIRCIRAGTISARLAITSPTATTPRPSPMSNAAGCRTSIGVMC